MFVDSPVDWCVTLPDFCNLGGVNTSGGSRGAGRGGGGGAKIWMKKKKSQKEESRQGKQNKTTSPPSPSLSLWSGSATEYIIVTFWYVLAAYRACLVLFVIIPLRLV